jgi:hypothetical protein
MMGTSQLLPRDQTLMLEESKFDQTHGGAGMLDGGDNVSSSDFLAGLGIGAQNKTAPIGRISV